MFYRKNVFAWEQIVRLVAGVALILAGLLLLSGWAGYAVVALGLYVMLTGIFGYCPACAMVGRKPVDRS
ncbi:hypothetical protein VW23_020670 [Devosia insulae DS-56]|uniref:Inner membrane protein YgaP-like transmembrane domain-containing protein n=1 Tax=Devosia insulae DS-56 TaxID=1116389 RepID=A0A1E5XPR6_9HYPH|nr:DUF2892 domain-containing protein [Devosia insulae]OEO30583.1 hypothetical protein VW23_020670 [Devosia insulae DS-56]